MKLIRGFEAEPFQKIEPAEAWHFEVEQDHVRHWMLLAVLVKVLAFQVTHSFDTIADYIEPNVFRGTLELLLHKQHIVRVILDQQEIAGLLYHAGFRSIISYMCTEKAAPLTTGAN